MIFRKLLEVLALVTSISACEPAAAADTTKPSPQPVTVMVSQRSAQPDSMSILPGGQLLGCPNETLAGVCTKTDSRFTAVLLSGKAVLGYQQSDDPEQGARAETVFFECGQEIYRVLLTSRTDASAAPTPGTVPPAAGPAGEIILALSSLVSQGAQEPAVQGKGREGERQFPVQVSESDPNLFLCDGKGPIALRLPSFPFFDTGWVRPSSGNPQAAYLEVNEAAFNGDGEYRSARDLWVSCGGIETKLEMNPEKIPGQIVIITVPII
jgi:hypothetical protein